MTTHLFQPFIGEGICRVVVAGQGGEQECGLLESDPVHTTPFPAQEGVFSEATPFGVPMPKTPEAPDRERYTTFTGTFTVDAPPSTMQGAIIFFDKCVELMDQKNLNYGDAWRSQGYMGNLARVLSKVSRLRNMLWRSDPSGQVPDQPTNDPNQETIRDTLMDLSNLCYFMARNLGEGNQWGE